MSLCKIINYPALNDADEVQGKFVQFRWRGVEYLLFATKEEHRFHNQMLARFLDEHGLPHRWQSEENLEIEVDDLAVIGGGRFYHTNAGNQLELWDNSQAYGRFDENGLEACIHSADHPWAGAKVMIR